MKEPERRGFAVWFTGLPASGKTALARAVAERLDDLGIATEILDSDELRRRLVPDPTYTPEERDWFYDLVVFLAELLVRNGVNVLIAATGQRRAYRDAARAKVARFAEVYVACAPAVCRARDPKGLWEMAERGKIRGLPGVDATYEAPLTPEVILQSDQVDVAAAADVVIRALDGREFWA